MTGGDLTALSELGKGSTFTARLPAEVRETPQPFDTEAQRTAGAPSTALPPRSDILVIDDEPAARDLVQRALTKEGYHVTTAASGLEGIALARRLQPDAITLDVMMSGMDGWAVLTALKADPLTAEIPVVMVTVVDEKNLGFALGASDYLIKPIEWGRWRHGWGGGVYRCLGRRGCGGWPPGHTPPRHGWGGGVYRCLGRRGCGGWPPGHTPPRHHVGGGGGAGRGCARPFWAGGRLASEAGGASGQ